MYVGLFGWENGNGLRNEKRNSTVSFVGCVGSWDRTCVKWRRNGEAGTLM